MGLECEPVEGRFRNLIRAHPGSSNVGGARGDVENDTGTAFKQSQELASDHVRASDVDVL